MSVSHIREGLLQEGTDKKFYLINKFPAQNSWKHNQEGEKSQYADLVPIWAFNLPADFKK